MKQEEKEEMISCLKNEIRNIEEIIQSGARRGAINLAPLGEQLQEKNKQLEYLEKLKVA